jgi:FtsP/CotA-like multicopper oxidase with cupredoxin domain
VPATWNVAPNGFDGIHGRAVANPVIPAVVYRRYSRGWKRQLPVEREGIQGPLLRARAGDRLRVHFRNMDTLAPHSMHFHGVEYRPGSDGSYIPGFSGPGGNVPPGRSFTYELHAERDSTGFWPYHDHSASMEQSLANGLYGGLSIFGRRERLPDKEFVVAFAEMGELQTIGGRAFVGNTPIPKARVGDTVQWDVFSMGSDHHTFHVHGHRWKTPAGVSEDTRTVGPAESFRVRWRERNPGTWLYHCHVEDHMARGMIGLYRVAR